MGFCRKINQKINPHYCLCECEKRNEIIPDILTNNYKKCWKINFFAYKEDIPYMKELIKKCQPDVSPTKFT